MLTVLRSLALLDKSFTINSVSLFQLIQCLKFDDLQERKNDHDNAIYLTNFEVQGWIQRYGSNLW